MKGKEFEKLLLDRMAYHERQGEATMSRYGVHATFMKNRETGKAEWRPIHSLPDFEGVLAPDGRQFVVECKVSNQASLNLQDSHFSDRQLKHLLTRARFGSISILLIHFPERILKTRTDEAQTWAFPVFDEHQFWQLFAAGGTRSISRGDCQDYAVPVQWNTTPGGRTERPDLLAAIRELGTDNTLPHVYGMIE